jgi:hypothetical protein
VPAASVNLHRLAGNIREIPMSGMIAAAKTAKKIVTDEGTRIAGADGMRGKKRRGLKLRARDDIRQTDTGTTCRIQGSVPAWIWATSGTAAHPIRRRNKGPMRKMTVQHPGTPGRHAWDRVADRITLVVPEIFRDAVHEAVSSG